MTEADDIALLRRYAEDRSEAAFATLVERHLGLVYGAARRQLGGAEHRAQDVAQSVFVDLARQAGKLAGRQEIAGWLYTSTRFAAAKLKRTEQRRAEREQEAHAMNEIHSADPAAHADWNRLRPVLDEAMHALGESDRATILQRFFQGRRFAEIGRQLGVSEDAARVRLDRALDRLRGQLARRGIASSAAALSAALAHPALAAAPVGLATTVTGAALAGAAMGAGSSAVTTGTFVFMKKSTAAACAAILAALLLSIHQINARREAEAARAAMASELATMQTQLQETGRRLAVAEQQGVELRQKLAAPPAAPTVAAPRSGGGGGFSFVQMPSHQEAPRNQLAEAMSSVYSQFCTEFGMSSAQRDTFIKVLTETKEYGNELFGEAVRSGIKPSDQLSIKIQQKVEAEREKRIRAEFGDAAWRDFSTYEAAAPLRSLASQMASALFRSETPLSPAQADQLVTRLKAQTRITTVNGSSMFDVTTLDSAAFLKQAQGLLSPPQMEVLQRQLESAQRNEQARQQRLRQIAEGK